MDELDKKIKKVLTQNINIPNSYINSINTAFIEKKKNRKVLKNLKPLNIIAVLLIIILLGVTTPNIYADIKWNIEYKEFENRKVEYGSATVKDAVDMGYKENIEMEYIYHDNIGIKLSSLMITDDYFSMDIDFKINKDTDINTETFNYGFAVYDENKNVYGVYEPFDFTSNKESNYWKKLYKQENIEYNKKDVFAVELSDSKQGANVIKSIDKNLVTKCSMTSVEGFPKSKKLYIRIFDLNYTMYYLDENKNQITQSEKFQISDSEWCLEVQVPEKFYQRETINLSLSQNVDGFQLTKLVVTDTGTTIVAKMDGFIDIIMNGKDITSEEFEKNINETINISNEEGKVYSLYRDNFGTYKEGKFKANFEINKNDLNKKLYLNLKINGKQYKIELIQNKI